MHLAAAGERIGEWKSGTKAGKVVLAVFPRLRSSFTAAILHDYTPNRARHIMRTRKIVIKDAHIIFLERAKMDDYDEALAS